MRWYAFSSSIAPARHCLRAGQHDAVQRRDRAAQGRLSFVSRSGASSSLQHPQQRHLVDLLHQLHRRHVPQRGDQRLGRHKRLVGGAQVGLEMLVEVVADLRLRDRHAPARLQLVGDLLLRQSPAQAGLSHELVGRGQIPGQPAQVAPRLPRRRRDRRVREQGRGELSHGSPLRPAGAEPGIVAVDVLQRPGPAPPASSLRVTVRPAAAETAVGVAGQDAGRLERLDRRPRPRRDRRESVTTGCSTTHGPSFRLGTIRQIRSACRRSIASTSRPSRSRRPP